MGPGRRGPREDVPRTPVGLVHRYVDAGACPQIGSAGFHATRRRRATVGGMARWTRWTRCAPSAARARWKQLVGHVVTPCAWTEQWRQATAASGSRGTYSLPDRRARGRAGSAAARDPVARDSAAEHWGWSPATGQAETVRLTVPFEGAAHQATRRRQAPLPRPRRRRRRWSGDVTTKLQTVVDCLRDESLRVALSVGDSALRARDVRRDELFGCGRRAPRSGQRPSHGRGRELLDGRAANAFESCARAILIEAGITGFEPQVSIRHRDVYIGRVDLADRACASSSSATASRRTGPWRR